jgi:hypothetical protein
MNARISETVRRQGASGKTLEQDSAALQPIKTSTYKTISHDKLERMRESIIKTVRSWRQGYPEGSLRSKHITEDELASATVHKLKTEHAKEHVQEYKTEHAKEHVQEYATEPEDNAHPKDPKGGQ